MESRSTTTQALREVTRQIHYLDDKIIRHKVALRADRIRVLEQKLKELWAPGSPLTRKQAEWYSDEITAEIRRLEEGSLET